MLRSRIVLAAALLVVTSGSARAGAVAGRLYLSRSAAVADSAGHAKSFQRLQSGVRDAVVSIEPCPPEIERQLKRSASARGAPRIDQAHMKFLPRVVVVAVGDSVQFTNLDTLYHNVFSVSSACHFDLGRMPPGQIESVRFTKAGVINLHCELHPEMIGYVVVLPHRLIARPDSLGVFALPPLPSGHYVLRAWHPHGGEVAQDFDVPRRGDAHVTLTF